MSLFPTRRLLAGLGVWLGAALLGAVWPVSIPLVLASGLAFVSLVVWDVRLLARQPLLEVERIVPDRAVVGRTETILYRIRNAGAAPVAFDIEDEWPMDLAAAPPEPITGRVAAAAGAKRRAEIWPSRLGDRRLGRIQLFEGSPLGFVVRRRLLEDGAAVPVFPDARRVVKEALDPRRTKGDPGQRPQRRRGEGSDFESLRDYVVGDDPRHVDWAATARRGRLVTRLHRHERNHTVVLAIDHSRLMGARGEDGRTKLEHVVDAALALSMAALARQDRVEVLTFDRDVTGHVAPRAHRGSLGPIVELLRSVTPTSVEADYRRLVRGLMAARRNRAICVVLTDFTDAVAAEIERPLQLLRRQHPTLLVAVRDPLFGRLRIGADAEGGEARDAIFQRLAIDELLRDREIALARLRHAAIPSVDLPPEQIVAPMLNRYIELRYSVG